MASNDALIKEAQALATELGLTVTTEGLTNAQLVALVSDLKAKKTDAETPTQADEAEAKVAEEAKAAEEAKVAEAAKVAEEAEAAKVAEEAKAAKVAEVAEAAKVAEEAKAAKVAEVAEAAKVAEEAEAAKVAEEAAKLPKLPERDVKGKRYYVEPGRAITTLVGMLSDNQELPPKVVELIGKEALQARVKSGILYRGK